MERTANCIACDYRYAMSKADTQQSRCSTEVVLTGDLGKHSDSSVCESLIDCAQVPSCDFIAAKRSGSTCDKSCDSVGSVLRLNKYLQDTAQTH